MEQIQLLLELQEQLGPCKGICPEERVLPDRALSCDKQSFCFSNMCPLKQATLGTYTMKGREGGIKGEIIILLTQMILKSSDLGSFIHYIS